MFNRIISFSLKQRVLVVCATVLLLIWGVGVVIKMPVDVLPDLNRPVVTIMTESHGLAPEEVEPLVTFPIEASMNGAPGVERVRSASSAGLSVVWVEFGWGVELMRARQIVTEKLQSVQSRLPAGALPGLAPVSSIMGEVMLLSLSSKSGKTPPMEVRSLAEWVVRPRLLATRGVSQVVPIGGGMKQFQVLTNPTRLAQYGVSLDQLTEAVRESNRNTAGGFLQEPTREAVVRIMGRARTPEEISQTVIVQNQGTPITVGQVAEVRFEAGPKRGDGSVSGEPGVILSVQKQPGANTLELTRELDKALDDLKSALPEDVKVNQELFRQSTFIEAAVENVVSALRDGGALVVVIVLAFLWSWRATLISALSIPVSFVVAMLVLDRLGISVNTMTLGGLAVAIGLVVDDSIVDVENVVRRLKENAARNVPLPPLQVVFAASCEVRNSIVFATLIIVLVFVPLLSLEGMEGKVFLPLGIAFIAALSASLCVSLTLTPALCGALLAVQKPDHHDPWLVTRLKRLNEPLVRWALKNPIPVIGTAVAMTLVATALVPFLGREFLPPFNEGSLSVSAILPPGTSLAESNRVGSLIEKSLLSVPEVTHTGRRTGRAEMDEHAEGVNYSEIDVGMKPGKRPRAQALSEIRQKMKAFPGVTIAVGQPISHRLDHLSSGVRAALAVKVFGPDIEALRQRAQEVRTAMQDVAGVVDLMVEPQIELGQVRIEIDRVAAARYGLLPGRLAETLEIALGGESVGQVLQGQRVFELVVWFDADSRNNLETIAQTLIATPSGARIPLGQVASVKRATGPNTINRENVSRRIVVQANVQGRDLNGVVTDLQKQMLGVQKAWPPGYYVEYGGQFESQQNAMSRILLLGGFTLVAIFLALFVALGSWKLALQVMVNLPLALVGGVLAVYLTGGVLSVASLVGFITLFGIATRNGIMMLSHYQYLQKEEGVAFGEELIVRGTLERLAPVLMTALAAALGLLPLALSVGQPGKELLQPIAVVILGGLLSSTFLDQLVTPVLYSRIRDESRKKGFHGEPEVAE
jgi:CzcA family heavy metal efflux pump